MSTPQRDMPTLIDELLAAATEVKGLLSDCRTMLKTMRHELAEAEQTKNGYMTELANAVNEDIDTRIHEDIQAFFADLNERIEGMVDIKAGQVGDLFNKLINLYMYGNERGVKASGGDTKVVDMIQAQIDQLGKPITKEQRAKREEQKKRRGVTTVKGEVITGE